MNIALKAKCSHLKPEWEIGLTAEKNAVKLTISKDGEVLNDENLSFGEKICVNYLIKSVLAMLTGIKCVILDNTEGLDAKTIEALEKMNQNDDVVLIISSPKQTKSTLKTINI